MKRIENLFEQIIFASRWIQAPIYGGLIVGALVGISGIHLLKSFIDITKKDPDHIKWQVIIHIVFLFSALALAYTEKLLHASENTSAKLKHS